MQEVESFLPYNKKIHPVCSCISPCHLGEIFLIEDGLFLRLKRTESSYNGFQREPIKTWEQISLDRLQAMENECVQVAYFFASD